MGVLLPSVENIKIFPNNVFVTPLALDGLSHCTQSGILL
jgi:hypothetical protein